jgi:diguanylate cyclase (GGDEF)-like protein/PAS domain S-box-containing protein
MKRQTRSANRSREKLTTHIGPREILDSMLDPLLLLRPQRDAAGRVTNFTIAEANQAAAEHYRRDRESLINLELQELLPPDQAASLLAMACDAHESGEPLVVNNFLGSTDETPGPERRFDIRAVRIDDHVMWTWREVTERFLAAKRLAASEERYRRLVENSSDVVARIYDGVIIWISPSVQRTFGWTQGECIGRPVEDFVEPGDREICAKNMARLEKGHTVLGRCRIISKQGSSHWIETHASPYLDSTGQTHGFLATTRVVDAQVAMEQELEQRARTDELTELLNRKEVLSRIDALRHQPPPTGGSLAVIFCDLDGFKKINDTLGHAVGDEVLRTIARRLRENLRSTDDLAARLGGDELLVVLHGVPDLASAMAVAEKFRRAAEAPIITESGPVQVTLSIGVTIARPGERTDAIVARADDAMYEAKATGRNQVASLEAPSGD